jgi:hypothetical protein
MQPKRDDKGHFLAGSGGPGRKPGSRNKLGQDFINAYADEFEEHGREAVRKVRDPATFLKIIANILPKQLETSLTVSVFATQEIQDIRDFNAAWKLVRQAQQFIGVDPSMLIEGPARAEIESERRDCEFDD